MADTLVERLTGQTTTTDLTIEIGLIMPLTTLVPHHPPPPHPTNTHHDRTHHDDTRRTGTARSDNQPANSGRAAGQPKAPERKSTEAEGTERESTQRESEPGSTEPEGTEREVTGPEGISRTATTPQQTGQTQVGRERTGQTRVGREQTGRPASGEGQTGPTSGPAGGDDPPAELLDYGPIPAPLARELLANTQGALFLRRLFTNPTGHLVDADTRRRRFPPAIAALILARDQHCRDPYCDAPIRHLDHITRHTDGGPTTTTNGRGVCARGNYTRELPGWDITLTRDGTHGRAHQTTVTTPTGHTYTSQAPMPP